MATAGRAMLRAHTKLIHHPSIARSSFPLVPPSIDEEYFEWIALLEAVQDAERLFTLVELGAGYGRWSARAIQAAHAENINGRAILVEAEPAHANDIGAYMASSGIDRSSYSVINAAVGTERGATPFCVEGPNGLSNDNWYGQSLLSCAAMDRSQFKAVRNWLGRPVRYYGKKIFRSRNGWAIINADVLTLAEILPNDGIVDLIDLDIQNAEGAVVRANIDLLTERVKRVYVGTHSREVEKTIRADLSSAGWEPIFDYPSNAVAATEYGAISFQDGAQYWRNKGL